MAVAGALATLLGLRALAQQNELGQLQENISSSMNVTPLTNTPGAAGPGKSGPTVLGLQPWYERGGLQFSPEITGPGRSIPSWASGVFEDPETFYNWYQEHSDSPNFAAIQATIGSTTQAREDTLAGRQEAVSGLEELMGLITGQLEQFRGDPRRLELEDLIRARADPNYRMISQAEEGGFRNRIAQAAARQASARIGTAGARGTARSGTTLQDLAGVNTQAAAEGIQLQAQVEAANRQARAGAERDLMTYLDRGTVIENAMLQQLSAIEAEIAAIQSGVDFAPTDFLGFNQLDFGQQAYLDEVAGRDEALEAYISAWEEAVGADENFDWRDALDLFTNLQGTGLLEMLFNPG